jgi:hypothetical protein
MRRILAVAAILVAAIFILSGNPTRSAAQTYSVAVSAYANLPMFATEATAQKHCPADTVVWLNIPSGIYHLKGERWYGRTKHGAYVCKKEADAAGDRETENGQ